MIKWNKPKGLPEKNSDVLIKFYSGFVCSGVFKERGKWFIYACHCGVSHHSEPSEIEEWAYLNEVV